MESEVFADEFDFMARTTGGARYGPLLDLMPQSPDRALDAGCGTGLLTMHLARRVRHVVGLDISRSMIAVAEKHRAEQEHHNVTFLLADLEALPFVEQSFDFVVAASSIQRTRLNVTLPDLRWLVRPGGRLALHVDVSSFPRLRDWRVARILMTIPGALGYLRRYGFRTMWRLTRFQTSRAWLQQGKEVEFLRARREAVRERALVSSRPVPTPESLREMCQRLLPGCRLERTHRWAMTVVWEAPKR
jgi:ubiquinone/menaquinone biosynthesis C-methylase UbiE